MKRKLFQREWISLFLVGFCAILALGVAGCSEDELELEPEPKEEEDILGKWNFESRIEEGVNKIERVRITIEEAFEASEGTVKASYTASMEFYPGGTLRTKYTFEFEMDLSPPLEDIKGSIKITNMGTYSISGSNYKLEFGRNLFVIISEDLRKLGFTEENQAVSLYDEGDVETGRWSRSGNTLTLISDDGVKSVLKKE